MHRSDNSIAAEKENYKNYGAANNPQHHSNQAIVLEAGFEASQTYVLPFLPHDFPRQQNNSNHDDFHQELQRNRQKCFLKPIDQRTVEPGRRVNVASKA